jgi:phage terminase large subunit
VTFAIIKHTLLQTAEVFEPLLDDARYKGARGGRGSGKSHFFAELMCETALAVRGFRGLCVREVQKSLKESSKRLIEDKLTEHNLWREGFTSFKTEISTPGDGLISFIGMQDHTAETIKSFEGADRAWCEEAQTLSPRSLTMLRPTIREKGSEIWASWNTRYKTDAVDEMFIKRPPTGSKMVIANWRDNPWFPAELEQERQDMLRDQPELYANVWEGQYAVISEGAYYAKQLAAAMNDNRITDVPWDPLAPVSTFWDLGKSDKTAIWFVQGAGGRVRVIDYYEKNREELSHYAKLISEKPYTYEAHWLPHDAKQDIIGMPRTREAQLKTLLGVNKIKIAPSVSVEDGINAVRAIMPRCWFDKTKCEIGLEMLGRYHEKMRAAEGGGDIGLGPAHDPASHGADAFRYFAVSWKDKIGVTTPKPRDYAAAKPRHDGWGGGW